jgi:hypothetical protein
MATAENTEGLMECLMCVEACTEPHMLQCGHMFCVQCIHKLEENQRIKCPKCSQYTQINKKRKDCDVASFIDSSKQNLSNLDNKDAFICDLCEDPLKTVSYFCQACNHYICTQCFKIHNKLKATHNAISVDGIITNLKSQIYDNLTSLNKTKTDLENNLQDVDNEIAQFEQEQSRLHLQIDRIADSMIAKINTMRDEMKNETTKECKYFDDLKACRVQTKHGFDSNDIKISLLGECLYINNIKHLIETIEKMGVSRIISPTLPTKKMEYTIKETKTFNPKDYIEVRKIIDICKTVDDSDKSEITSTTRIVLDNEKQVNTVEGMETKLNFNSIIGKNIKVVQLIQVKDGFINRAVRIHDNIWVTKANNSMVVYSKELIELANIKHGKLIDPCGLMATDKQMVIVACNTGLHVINTDYEYSEQISSGYFYDVKYHQENLYALKNNPECVEVYIFVENKWKLQQTIAMAHVQYSYHTSYYRIFLSPGRLTVATDKTLYIHNLDGILLEQINHPEGTQPGQFGGCVYGAVGFMCGVDDNNTELYADCYNHRLQLRHVAGEWSVVKLPSEIQHPQDVSVDSKSGYMWISNVERLYKVKFS